MNNRAIQIAAVRHNRPFQPIYFTSETIYNHSKEFLCNSSQSSPSFLKESVQTPHLTKHSCSDNLESQTTRIIQQYECPSKQETKVPLSDLTNINITPSNSVSLSTDLSADLQNLTKLSDSLYNSALKRDKQIKWLLSQQRKHFNNEQEIKSKAKENNIKKIKLREIIENNPFYVGGNEKCVLANNERSRTLEDEYPHCNFQVDENLNYIRIEPEASELVEIKEEEEETERLSENKKRELIQTADGKITERISSHQHQNQEHHSQKRLLSKDSQIDIENGNISTIQIESKDFWLSSEQMQQKNKHTLQVEQPTKRKMQIRHNFQEKQTPKKFLSMNSSNLESSIHRQEEPEIKRSEVVSINSYENSQITNRNSFGTHNNSRSNYRRHSSCSKNAEPKGVYQQILSGYSTAKLLAINKRYKQNRTKSTPKDSYPEQRRSQHRNTIMSSIEQLPCSSMMTSALKRNTNRR